MELQSVSQKTQSELQAVRDFLNAELDRIYQHAKIICDLHWENISEESGDRSPHYITRVRLSAGSLQCHWLRAGSRPPSKPGGIIQAVYIPKGTARFNPRYKSSAFNKADPWEREIIDETEHNYAMLRERYMIISKMKNDLLKTMVLAQKSYERAGIPWTI